MGPQLAPKAFSLYQTKKYRFLQNEVQFLGYVVSLQSIYMEDEKIETICDGPQTQSVRDIQILLRFANFYRWFI